MVKELWTSFPRLIEQRMQSLLDEADPQPMKAFHLYKSCQQENVWSGSFEKFQEHLRDYFARPRADRRKIHLDRFLERPLPSALFESFHLNFRTAQVSTGSLDNLASWTHNLMRVGAKLNSPAWSIEVFARTLRGLTSPAPHEKSANLQFEDFCEAWKTMVFRLFGQKYDSEMARVLNELRWFDRQSKEANTDGRSAHFPTIYLTQTEIDWTQAVQQAVENHLPAPAFPLSRGPQKHRLIELERTLNLYRIVQTTRLPELLKHRERIRATILDRCEGLLRDRAS